MAMLKAQLLKHLLRIPSDARAHRQERPRSPSRQRQARLHPRIQGTHRMLRQVGDAPRLHRSPMQHERQDLFQATAGTGARPGHKVQDSARRRPVQLK